MDVQMAVRQRHSVRKYTDDSVPKELLRDLIDAAHESPTWANGQEIRYNIVKSEQARERLLDASDYNRKYFARATEIVVVSAVKNVAASGDAYSHTSAEWTMFDGGIAVGAFTLLAWERGIGTVIVGDYDVQVVAEAVALPSGEMPIAVICLGYPAFPPKSPKKMGVQEVMRCV